MLDAPHRHTAISHAVLLSTHNIRACLCARCATRHSSWQVPNVLRLVRKGSTRTQDAVQQTAQQWQAAEATATAEAAALRRDLGARAAEVADAHATRDEHAAAAAAAAQRAQSGAGEAAAAHAEALAALETQHTAALQKQQVRAGQW